MLPLVELQNVEAHQDAVKNQSLCPSLRKIIVLKVFNNFTDVPIETIKGTVIIAIIEVPSSKYSNGVKFLKCFKRFFSP